MSEIHPMNGLIHVRVKASEGCAVLACGCAHNETMWLQLCDTHYQEWLQLHALRDKP